MFSPKCKNSSSWPGARRLPLICTSVWCVLSGSGTCVDNCESCTSDQFPLNKNPASTEAVDLGPTRRDLFCCKPSRVGRRHAAVFLEPFVCNVFGMAFHFCFSLCFFERILHTVLQVRGRPFLYLCTTVPCICLCTTVQSVVVSCSIA